MVFNFGAPLGTSGTLGTAAATTTLCDLFRGFETTSITAGSTLSFFAAANTGTTELIRTKVLDSVLVLAQQLELVLV